MVKLVILSGGIQQEEQEEEVVEKYVNLGGIHVPSRKLITFSCCRRGNDGVQGRLKFRS